MCRSHWRNSSHFEGSIVASVEGVVVGDELEVENAASRRIDLPEDLESGFSKQVAKLSTTA
jgi:hypothetical protein